MKRWLPLVAGIVVAIVCGRLGLWQLDRLAERRASNAAMAAALVDTVTVTGVFDFARDSVLTLRAHQGAPGVWIVTPLVRPTDDTVRVLRGFAPSPDGRAIDLSAYREPESATVTGVRVDGVLRRIVLPPDPPARFAVVPPPALDEGPHFSYAVQWFTFGLIGLVGGVVLSLTRAGSGGKSPS